MACNSKYLMLHPVRQQAIKAGINTICDSCMHSFYTTNTESGKTKFDECLLSTKITDEKNDCSQFALDSKVMDDEERAYYEENGICWD